LLRAHADPNGYRGAPLHVRIAKKAGGWQCTNVWSNNISCPPNFERPVDLALKGVGDPPYRISRVLAMASSRNIDAVEFAVLEWVDWFNNRRLLEPLDYIPPAEYEAAYYRGQTTPAAVAGLN
jgi:transposase InsO family protein